MPSNAKRRARRKRDREEARQQKNAPTVAKRMISVYSAAGLILQKDCDPSTISRYGRARNAHIVLKHGALFRIDLIPLADESELNSIAGGTSSTYQEQLDAGHLTVLKKLKHGQLVKWNKKDRFARKRFNPDLQVGQVLTRKSWRPPTTSAAA